MECDVSDDVTRVQEAQRWSHRTPKRQVKAYFHLIFIQYILKGGVEYDVNDGDTGAQEAQTMKSLYAQAAGQGIFALNFYWMVKKRVTSTLTS